MDKEIITKSKAQIKNKWFETKEDELDMALNIVDDLEQQVKKQKETINKIEKYIEKEIRIYGFSMSIELGTHFDNILGILKGEK